MSMSKLRKIVAVSQFRFFSKTLDLSYQKNSPKSRIKLSFDIWLRRVRISQKSKLLASVFLSEVFLMNLIRNFLWKVRKFIEIRISSSNISFKRFLFESKSKYTLSQLGHYGYLEDLNKQKPSAGQEFFVYERDNSVTRILLVPAGFINHSCEPNVKFECGGATKLVVRVIVLRVIYAGEKMVVKYSSCYCGLKLRIANMLPVFQNDWFSLRALPNWLN